MTKFFPISFICFFQLIIWMIFFAVGVLGTVFWVMMLVDVIKRDFERGNDRIMWVLIIILTHFIGALIYYFVEKKDK